MKILISKIKIGDRFRNSPGDVTSLAKSIEILGLLEPIGVAADDMTLIYGRRRVAAYTKLGIKEIEACMVPSNIDHRLAEVHENRERLAHTVEEIAAIDDYLREKFEAEARLRQKKGTKNDPSEIFAKGKSSAKIARILHASDRQLEKIRAIKGSSTEGDFTQKIWQKVAAGKMKVDKGYNQVKRFQRIKEAEKLASSSFEENSMVDLQLGLMQDLGKKIPAGSIDMIFTDPPYKRESLYLYGELAKLAQRVLKLGGSMVTFIGHYAIFEINDLIRKNSDLIFHWPIVVVHDGRISRLHAHRMCFLS